MHILVTGANGYLGSVTLRLLLASKQMTKITALVRNPVRFSSNRSAVPKNVEIVDVKNLFNGTFSLSGIDRLCHLAAGGRENGNPDDIATSMEFSRTLLNLAASERVPGILFASSQAVYGTRPPLWHEKDAPAPVSLHGMAKYATEMLLQSTALLVPGIRTSSLRFSKLVGPSPVLRISHSEPPHLFSWCAISSKRVTLPAGGRQLLDMMDVRDAATVIVRLMEKQPEDWPDILNVGSGHQISLLTIAERVSMLSETLYGKKLAFGLDKQTNNISRDFGMSTERLQNLLQWTPRYTLEETITHIMQLQEKHSL